MTIRCAGCGQFVAYREVETGGNASYAYVPDSALTYEEELIHCPDCTVLHGPPVPQQSVALEKCQGYCSIARDDRAEEQ